MTFPRERETSTIGKEITFHRATYPASGVYGTANDIRGTKEDAFDDSAHFRFFRCFVEMRVSSPSCHHVISERERYVDLVGIDCDKIIDFNLFEIIMIAYNF